ncbi:MAG: vitamin K epoxide reductase family protein [Kineosporiaceae bacterium]
MSTTATAEVEEPLSVLGRLRRIRHSNRYIFITMLISSCISLTASFVLSVDALALAKDPAAALSCNINSVISCGKVGASWQASLFGFPNAYLGLIAEPVVLTIAVASLGGVVFPRWFMFSAQIVYTFGLFFAYWLFTQSMFVIHALCPWCLLVTVSTTTVFTSMTHVNIRDGNLFLPRRVNDALRRFIDSDLDIVVLTIWLLLIALAIVLRYGSLLFS